MLPKSSILNMFARSPIRPLQKHMDKANQCAKLLDPFFQNVIKNNWEKTAQLQSEISQLENDADDMKKDLRLHLPKGLFLPVSRTDLLNLLTKQEAVANTAKDIAGITLGRKLHIPESLHANFMTYLRRCIDAVSQANKAIRELDELLESGFRGKEVSLVETMLEELNNIEHDTDVLQVQLRDSLYAIETDLPPTDVYFLYDVIKKVGSLADEAEHTGNQLLILLAH